MSGIFPPFWDAVVLYFWLTHIISATIFKKITAFNAPPFSSSKCSQSHFSSPLCVSLFTTSSTLPPSTPLLFSYVAAPSWLLPSCVSSLPFPPRCAVFSVHALLSRVFLWVIHVIFLCFSHFIPWFGHRGSLSFSGFVIFSCDFIVPSTHRMSF